MKQTFEILYAKLRSFMQRQVSENRDPPTEESKENTLENFLYNFCIFLQKPTCQAKNN